MADSLDLLLDAHPRDPVLDLAVTHALLREVAAGQRQATARVFRPGPTLAFGRLDAVQLGFAAAAQVGRTHGYTPATRIGGGRAVVYDSGSVQFDLVLPQQDGPSGTDARFEYIERVMLETLSGFGVSARRGELPGEYCAGRWSIHASGIKLAGAAQRVVRGAALVTAIIPVEGTRRLRRALIDIYRELGIEWRPTTCGALEDLVEGTEASVVADALVVTLAREAKTRPIVLDPTLLSTARALLPMHSVGSVPNRNVLADLCTNTCSYRW